MMRSYSSSISQNSISAKTLTPTEMKKILFFYDELKFSPDLIEYLIEYSVSRGHKSMRYIETVALAWADEGITTVTMAKEANSRYAKEYFTIFKSMGISGRNPVDTEISLMNTWLNDYGFTMDIIQEACSRTVLSTGQPSFQYADKNPFRMEKIKNCPYTCRCPAPRCSASATEAGKEYPAKSSFQTGCIKPV